MEQSVTNGFMDIMTSADLLKAKSTIKDRLSAFEGKKVLVVGDIGLDEYLMGDVRRISPEAPVPVVEVKNHEFRLGLAANVAQNIVSLGGACQLFGVVGNDASAENLRKLLKENSVSELQLIVDKDRPTTRKVRVMSGQHHIVRVDFEEKKFLHSLLEEQLIKNFQLALKDAVGVILQDYGKGLLSESLCQKLIEKTHSEGKKVVIDPHRTTPLAYYRGADLIKPNRDEAFIISGLNIGDSQLNESSITLVGKAIQDKARCSNVVVTEGKNGVVIFAQQNSVRVPTTSQQVFDVTGAGDTFVAALSLGWFNGLDLVTSAAMANAASGVVVGKVGCVPCSKLELLTALTG